MVGFMSACLLCVFYMSHVFYIPPLLVFLNKILSMYYFNLLILLYYNFGNFLSHWSGVTVCILPYHNFFQMNANLIPVKYRNFVLMWLYSFPFLCAIIAARITSTYVTWRRK